MTMKISVVALLAAGLLLSVVAQASSQSSPNYTINAGRIVSGGGSAVDLAGMSKNGIAIGQGVFIPAGKVSSPGFGSGTVALAAIATAPLIVSTLPDGATTAVSPLTISGTVSTNPPIKSLTINGIPVTINADGSFTVGIPLHQGSNSITITATDQNLVATSQTRTVIYTPTAAPITITSIADNSSVPMAQSTVLVGGTVGANITGMTISINGGPPQAVPLVNSAFSVNSAPLVTGLNTIVITATTGTGGTSSRALTLWRVSAGSVLAHTGDVNGDGVVDIVDALLALQATVGVLQLSAAELTRADVGPLYNTVPVGDGRIDIEDAMLILRKIIGLGW